MLLDLFQELLDLCYEDIRPDNDSHYNVSSFWDIAKAKEFESKLDKAIECLADYSEDISENMNELLLCGVSYESVIDETIEIIERDKVNKNDLRH